MRIGMLCKYDNSGLGTLSFEFARHLKPSKVLLVSNNIFQTFPERYAGFDTRKSRPGMLFMDGEKEWITDDIDILFTIETFYDWSIIQTARRKNVKTILMTMVEMTPEVLPRYPHWFLCPSKLDYEVFSKMTRCCTYLPVPLNTEKLIWRERKMANVFVHSASHGGQNGRKGTGLLLEAMKYVKSNIKLIIYSWIPFKNEDERVEVRVQNFKNYWQVWQEGDVLLYPQGGNGICLPIIEAMASGLAVITTNLYPFNEYMPKELLFEPERLIRRSISGGCIPIDDPLIKPEVIAEKIDSIAGKDISQFSNYGKEYALKHSWDVLLPQYQNVFKNILGA